jgi:hypothetical protein
MCAAAWRVRFFRTVCQIGDSCVSMCNVYLDTFQQHLQSQCKIPSAFECGLCQAPAWISKLHISAVPFLVKGVQTSSLMQMLYFVAQDSSWLQTLRAIVVTASKCGQVSSGSCRHFGATFVSSVGFGLQRTG